MRPVFRSCLCPRDVSSRRYWYRVRRSAESRPRNKICRCFAEQHGISGEAECSRAFAQKKRAGTLRPFYNRRIDQRSGGIALPQRINAPGTRAGKDEVEEHEAIDG